MTVIEAKEKLLSVARAELGYHEEGVNLTKYASQYDYDTRLYRMDMSGQPWCDYFVDWCFMKAFGFSAGSFLTYQYAGCCGASCSASAGYYRENRAFFPEPEVGDQIFFYSGGGINHTGIVEEVSGQHVKTIEGNSSDSVRENVYRRTDPSIAGYGRPNWGLVAGENAEETEGSAAEEGSAESGNGGASGFRADLDADGEFGPLTGASLLEFQKAFGLKGQDAEAGPETWDELALILGKKILRKGSQGWAVTALQAALNAISEAENGF